MARKKKEAPAKQEVSRKEINGNIIITYDDGTVRIIPAPIDLTAEQASEIFGSEEAEEEEEEEEEDEDSDEDEDDDDSEEDDSEDEDDDEEEDEEEDEDEDDSEDEDEDEDEEEDDPLTPEAIMGMDFEELEDLCDDKDLDTDPDDYDEDDIESFRKEVAKELGITLPKATKKSKKSKK